MDFLYPVIWGICKFFDLFLNIGIIILAVYEGFLGVRAFVKLASFREKINELNDESTKKNKTVKLSKRQMVTKETSITVRDWGAFDEFCRNYQKESSLFSRFSLIIQLFTLLGILGTVAGLFLALQGMDSPDAINMFEGVKFALSSTVLGIIFAVVYKVVDIILTAGFINYIDDGIERFRANYNEDREYGKMASGNARSKPDLTEDGKA